MDRWLEQQISEDDLAQELASAVTWTNFAYATDPDGQLGADTRRRRAEVERHVFLCRMILRRGEIRAAARDLRRLITEYEDEERAALAGTWQPRRPKPVAPIRRPPRRFVARGG